MNPEFKGKPYPHIEYVDEASDLPATLPPPANAHVTSVELLDADGRPVPIKKPERDYKAEYLKHAAEFRMTTACNQIEALLGPTQTDCRQARRRFKRLVEKHWPLEPDPQRHPRTKIFTDSYKARLAELKETPS